MAISDDALAQAYLNKIGYYRLTGYCYPYRKRHMAADGTVTVLDGFRVGTKFSEVIALYVFDKKLRLLMMDVIERIEVAFRVQITLQLGKRGPDAHRNPSALNGKFSTVVDPVSGITDHDDWLRRHDVAFDRSKEEFVKHFRNKYAGEKPPIWIAAELWDFGAMSVIFSGMKPADQSAVSKLFGIADTNVMRSWLQFINVARNICAHHSRFWNKPNAARPAWPKAIDCPDLGHIENDGTAKARVYGLACICAFLLRTINPNSRWGERFKQAVSEFPKSDQISLRSAGFPEDWERANLWQ